MCLLGNGTSCLGVRTVRNGNGKACANEDKQKKRNDRDVSMVQ